TNGPFQAGAAGASNPAGNGAGYRDRSDGGDFIMRTRAYAWFDSRQQTEYGTLRSYLQVGVNYDSPNATSAGLDAGSSSTSPGSRSARRSRPTTYINRPRARSSVRPRAIPATAAGRSLPIRRSTVTASRRRFRSKSRGRSGRGRSPA